MEDDDSRNCVGSCKKWICDFEALTIGDYLDSDPVDNYGDARFTAVWSSASILLNYIESNAALLGMPTENN